MKETGEILSLEKIRAIQNWQDHAWKSIVNGTSALDLETWATLTRDLKIREVDVFLGFMQPLLYQVGMAFQVGDISVEQEHRFSASVEKYIKARGFAKPIFSVEDNAGICDFLLTLLPGNRHIFSVNFVAIQLHEDGINVRIAPDLPSVTALIDYLEMVRPLVVGLSASMNEQLPILWEVLDTVKTMHRRPFEFAMLGGVAVRRKENIPEYSFAVRDPSVSSERVKVVRSLVAQAQARRLSTPS
jgi:hypothetical protein